MKKPAPLRAGSRLRVVALASAPDPARVARGVRRLRALGFEVELGDSLRRVRERGDLAASDEERAADLLAAFEDPSVDGVVASNGGFGSLRLLPLVDWDALAARAKLFVGYSDLTVVHSALGSRGLVTFHGPMVASDEREGLDDRWTRERFARAVTATRPLGAFKNPPSAPAPRTVAPGRARGRLAGGNLTLLSATLGTPWEPETAGRVLLLEDWNEPPYTVETLLLQLRLAGKLGSAAALVFGEFPGCVEREGPHRGVAEIVRETTQDLGIPVLFGFALGHGRRMGTVPLGVACEVDAEAGTVAVTEPATDPQRMVGRPILEDRASDTTEDEGEPGR